MALIVDFEGYQVGSTYFFKEIAIYDHENDTYQNFFVKCPKQNSRTYRWLVKYYHHIPHNYGTESHIRILKSLNSASVIYVKGLSKVQILDNYIQGPIIVNLENFACPKLSDLPYPPYQLACEFEQHNEGTRHCALKKVHLLSRWLDRL